MPSVGFVRKLASFCQNTCCAHLIIQRGFEMLVHGQPTLVGAHQRFPLRAKSCRVWRVTPAALGTTRAVRFRAGLLRPSWRSESPLRQICRRTTLSADPHRKRTCHGLSFHVRVVGFVCYAPVRPAASPPARASRRIQDRRHQLAQRLHPNRFWYQEISGSQRHPRPSSISSSRRLAALRRLSACRS